MGNPHWWIFSHKFSRPQDTEEATNTVVGVEARRPPKDTTEEVHTNVMRHICWVLNLTTLGKKRRSRVFDAVDGSEIQRSPVEVGSFAIIYKVLYIKGGAGCLPSTVVSWHLLFLLTKVASSTDSGARIHAKLHHFLSGVWEFLTLDFSNFKKKHVFFAIWKWGQGSLSDTPVITWPCKEI